MLAKAVPVQAQCGTYYYPIDCMDSNICDSICIDVCADVDCGLSINANCLYDPPDEFCVCTCVPNVLPGIVEQA